MYYIEHLGFGPLTNDDEVMILTFETEGDAIDYLANCDELDNIDTIWEVRKV